MANKRPVYAEDIIKIARENMVFSGKPESVHGELRGFNKALNLLDNVPTAEVKPVIHAHWLREVRSGEVSCTCSSCGCTWYLPAGDPCERLTAYYCPDCGAIMNEEVERVSERETFRERVTREHPEELEPLAFGGVLHCPCDYGYEKTKECPFVGDVRSVDEHCRECWDRVIPTDSKEVEE